MSGVICMGGTFKGRNTNLGAVPVIMRYIQFCSRAKWECSSSTLRHYLWNPCKTDLAHLTMVELIAIKLYRSFFFFFNPGTPSAGVFGRNKFSIMVMLQPSESHAPLLFFLQKIVVVCYSNFLFLYMPTTWASTLMDWYYNTIQLC